MDIYAEELENIRIRINLGQADEDDYDAYNKLTTRPEDFYYSLATIDGDDVVYRGKRIGRSALEEALWQIFKEYAKDTPCYWGVKLTEKLFAKWLFYNEDYIYEIFDKEGNL